MYSAKTTKERIKYLCKIKKIKMDDMLISCDLGVNAVRQINDIKGMASFSLAKIADFLNCSVDYLLGRKDTFEIDAIPDDVKKLSEKVYLEKEKSKIIPLYMTGASAGTGNWLSDDVPVEYMTIPQNDKTDKADYMLKVVGNSMQPRFFDGDFLLIKKSPSILEGEIGVFIVNNESFVKKMGRGELISLNPAYKSIKLTEYDDIRCAGKVIDSIVLK